MATYLGPGHPTQNCLGDALGVRHFVNPMVWHWFFEPCPQPEATHIVYLNPMEELALPSVNGFSHVVTVVRKGKDLERWVTVGKAGSILSRYRTTVREGVKGFRLAKPDRGQLWYWGDRLDFGTPVTVRRTNARPRLGRWWSNYYWQGEREDGERHLLRRGPEHYAWIGDVVVHVPTATALGLKPRLRSVSDRAGFRGSLARSRRKFVAMIGG